jgi:peptidoglycan/xylan/chitin deacetylase (PgdA/CDA1 family)
MRAASHCANHPSREATIRCVACGKWLCERCARESRDRSYCSTRCRLDSVRRTVVAGLRRWLFAPVEPPWALVLVSAACLLVVAAVVRLLVDVAELWTPRLEGVVEIAVPVRPAPPQGRIVVEAGVPRLHVTGDPGTDVVLLADGRPPAVLRLDGRGRATVDLLELELGTRAVRLGRLGSEHTVVPVPRLPSSNPTRSHTPSRTPTRTPSVTATPEPTRPSRQTLPPTAPPEPTDTAIPTRRRPAAPSEPTPAGTARPASAAPAPPVLHLVDDAGPRLALTFDGAISADGTAELLNLLQELDLQVTLFVTGKFVEEYPSLVRSALLAGHEVGNHTYSHPHLTTYPENQRHQLLPSISRQRFQSQLRRTEEAFRAATGHPMAPLWRAPYGEENATLRRWAMELGYLHIRWSSLRGASLDSLDWVEDEHSSLYFDSNRLVDRLLAFPELEGGIVLMHLATHRPVPPWSELPRFVAEIRGRGLDIVSVSALLESSDRWRPWLDRARARHAEVFPDQQ